MPYQYTLSVFPYRIKSRPVHNGGRGGGTTHDYTVVCFSSHFHLGNHYLSFPCVEWWPWKCLTVLCCWGSRVCTWREPTWRTSCLRSPPQPSPGRRPVEPARHPGVLPPQVPSDRQYPSIYIHLPSFYQAREHLIIYIMTREQVKTLHETMKTCVTSLSLSLSGLTQS